jgi:hypothetical protein
MHEKSPEIISKIGDRNFLEQTAVSKVAMDFVQIQSENKSTAKAFGREIMIISIFEFTFEYYELRDTPASLFRTSNFRFSSPQNNKLLTSVGTP